MTQKTEHKSAGSRLLRLIPRLRNKEFRHAYFEKSLKAYLSNQIRTLRGDATQNEFAQELGTSQSVVARMEDENYGKLNTQTLIEMANKKEMALIIKFVDYPTFLRHTADMSEAALRPRPFDSSVLSELADFRLPVPKRKVTIETPDSDQPPPGPKATSPTDDHKVDQIIAASV